MCKNCRSNPAVCDRACVSCIEKMDKWTLDNLGLIPDYNKMVVLKDGTKVHKMKKVNA